MLAPVRVLVCGPGLIGRKHASLVSGHAACDLVGLVGPHTDENVSFANGVGVPLYAELNEAFDAAEVDAVIVSSPNAFHREQASDCIRRGIPVMVEKPLTDCLEDAAALVDEAQSSGVPVLVGHHRTYSPLLDVADRFLDSPEFGRMVCVQGAALFHKPAHYFVDGAWRTRKGGGPILINLIHEIGLLRHFCGEIATVYAVAGRHIRGFEVEDTVAITLEFCSGALGNFLLSDAAASSKSWEMTSGENPSYPFFPDEHCYHFAGTHGSLDFPSMSARTYAQGVEPSWWSPFTLDRLAIQRADPLARQLEHFVDVVRGRATPKVTVADGYRNMQVVQAITDSIERRAVVTMAI